MKDCPFDPNYEFLFSGEELLLSACLFTNGWDIYNPSVNAIYHYYSDPRRNKVHIPSEENKKQYSLKRLFYNLKLNTSIPLNHISLYEIERYPLGNVRSIESYWDYSGINFHEKMKSSKKWCSMIDKDNISFLHKKNLEKYPSNLKMLPVI